MAQAGGGFRVLDGAALVLGAAVAAVHVRGLLGTPHDLSGLAWVLLGLAFAGIAVTTAGPFVLLNRGLGLAPGPIGLGDWLWALLGVPWLVAGVLRSVAGPDPTDRGSGPGLVTTVLALTLGAAALITLVVLWKTWVLAPPDRIEPRREATWSDRLGLALAVAWPLQCGFGLVLSG